MSHYNSLTTNLEARSEFEELFSEEFFIITSDTLDLVSEKLYGYMFNDGKVILNENDITGELTGEGTYLYLRVGEEYIDIFQDYAGSYGLYFFKQDNFFAISNSFLKLVEFLKHKYELSFNFDYAAHLMSVGLCSHIYKDTLVNEIKSVPRNYTIRIDKINGDIVFNLLDFEEHTVKLDSKEGLDLLDKWFYKWIDIVRFVKNKTNSIQFDLSGGFDSRMTFIFALCSNIDMNKIKIGSINNTKNKSYQEDFKIASKIANEFNFELNNPNVFHEKIIPFNDLSTAYDLSFYIKSGFNNQFNFVFYKREKPMYSFSGAYGESIRGYFSYSPEKFLDIHKNRAKRMDGTLSFPVAKILKQTFEYLSDDFKIDDNQSRDLVQLIYSENRAKNHFGKLSVERYLSNQIRFTPLLDPDLHKIKLSTEFCDDDDLLMTLIFLRYCPKLLDFEFEGNRKINEDTIEYAKQINQIKPFKQKNHDFISGPEINKEEIKYNLENFKQNFGVRHVNKYLKDIFYSKNFEMEFKKYFPDNIYNTISKTMETRVSFPLQNAMAAFSVMKVIHDVEFSHNIQSNDLNDWLDSFENKWENDDGVPPQYKELLLKYATARVDFINVGPEFSNLEVLENSDKFSNCTRPKWLQTKRGSGLVITSNKLSLNLKLKCINNGNLNMRLKSRDIKDKEKNRFPVYIDYTKVTINGKNYLKENLLITHDKPFLIKKPVHDGEILDIHIEWRPFNRKSHYEDEVPAYKEKINELQDKIKLLEDEIEKVKLN